MAVAVKTSGSFDISSDLRKIFSDRLKALDLNAAIKESIKVHNDEISDLNTEQLNYGQKADGSDTGEYRNFGYKGRLRPVDLKDTEDFHKSIFADPFDNAFDMNATDPKTEKLTNKYGDAILGLTPQNVEVTSEIIKPTFIQNVREQLK